MENHTKTRSFQINCSLTKVKDSTLSFLKNKGCENPRLSGHMQVDTYFGKKIFEYSFLFRKLETDKTAIFAKINVESYSSFDDNSFFRSYENHLFSELKENCSFCNFDESDFLGDKAFEDSDELPDAEDFNEAIANLTKAFKEFKSNKISKEEYESIYKREIKRL